MDAKTKTGKVYLQPHKAGKKWKPVWLSLFPPSSSGVGRLEIQDMGGGAAGGDHGTGVRRHHQHHVDRKPKVVRLSELISVLKLPPNAEACPMENMAAFCVETQDRTMVFAALKDDCVDWVEKLCYSTFQRGAGSSSNQLQMEENQIYASADDALEYWVVVQRTEAAERCGLQGSYWLQIATESLLLRDTQKKNIVQEWPYELLRRYGKDKTVLTIEAGRRCESGPGIFTFETQQAEKIFTLIQSTIKRKTSTVTVGNQNQEGEKVIVNNIQAHSPLPKIPDVISMASILGTQEKKSPALEESTHVQEDVVSSPESVSAQPPPITLMPLPSVPTHDSQSGSHPVDQSEAVYADPADCIQPATKKTQPTTAQYVDPASILPLNPPTIRKSVTTPPKSSASQPCFDIDHPDSGYSEVYDRVSPLQHEQVVTQSKAKTRFADIEPIYTEPMSKKETHKTESTPDPFAHLYAQVCKRTPSPSPSSSSNTVSPCSSSPVTADANTVKVSEQPLDDIIYENLGVI